MPNPTYGTFGTKLKKKVKQYTGFDDDAPRSITVKDWFKSNKTDIGPAVSHIQVTLLGLRPMVQRVSPSYIPYAPQ